MPPFLIGPARSGVAMHTRGGGPDGWPPAGSGVRAKRGGGGASNGEDPGRRSRCTAARNPASAAGSGVRVLASRHAGASAARNLGLHDAATELVCFLDADDLLAPAMLERTFSALAGDPEAVAAYCGWSRLTEGSEVVDHDFFRTSGDLFPVLAG